MRTTCIIPLYGALRKFGAAQNECVTHVALLRELGTKPLLLSYEAFVRQ